MLMKVITLRFSAALDGFDDAPLLDFIRDKAGGIVVGALLRQKRDAVSGGVRCLRADPRGVPTGGVVAWRQVAAGRVVARPAQGRGCATVRDPARLAVGALQARRRSALCDLRQQAIGGHR
jgi:hypothetical protein